MQRQHVEIVGHDGHCSYLKAHFSLRRHSLFRPQHFQMLDSRPLFISFCYEKVTYHIITPPKFGWLCTELIIAARASDEIYPEPAAADDAGTPTKTLTSLLTAEEAQFCQVS